MTEFSEAVQDARMKTLNLLHEAESLWGRSDLAQPSLGLEVYRKKLKANSYKVLVVGEAKRGKSTFVNAVIGEDTLPTDVDIATCQVFCVRRADQEAFRVRYEDGSAQKIELAELPKYGSQVLADSGNAPAQDEVIRWIEVDVPVRFLPQEVELLDTPGLGSLYAGHAEITQRLVPMGDGVIFVLGSNHPISDVEIHFLKELTEVTRHVFFIQTMIDQHRREHWQSIQQRNENILNEIFHECLGPIKIWPISSANLRTAASTGDEDYLKVSRFPELARALREFLFRTSGWATLAEAITATQRCMTEAAQTLDVRRKAVIEQSNAKRKEHRDQVAVARRIFDEQWGPRGEQRRALMEQIQKHATLARQWFQQTLHPGTGIVAQSFYERIDALQSLDEVRSFATTMNDEVLIASLSQWRSTCDTAKQKAQEELLPFLQHARRVDVNIASVDAAQFMTLPAVAQIESRYFDRMKAGVCDARTMSTAVGIPLALASLAFPPLGAVAIGGAALAFVAGAIRGPLRSMSQELLQAKQQLKSHLTQVLQNVHQRFFAVDQVSGRYSVVEEFCRVYVEGIARSIDEIAKGKQDKLRLELDQLDQQAMMTAQQRAEQGDQLSRLLHDWKQWGRRLEAISVNLGDIDEKMQRTGGSPKPSQSQENIRLPEENSANV